MSESGRSTGNSGGLRIRNVQDFVGGLALIAFALFALWASAALGGMRGFQFGPGTAPRMFAYVLLGFGVLIAGMALFIDGPGFPKFYARGPLLVVSSIVLFALAIRPLGLVIASFAMFVFSASASRETRWVESIIAAIGMTLFCVILFWYLLNLPFQLWPRFTIGGVTIAF